MTPIVASEEVVVEDDGTRMYARVQSRHVAQILARKSQMLQCSADDVVYDCVVFVMTSHETLTT